MSIKRHECNLTEGLLKRIEFVLPKLKYSVYLQQIKRWLENFEEQEVELALDYLFYLEYITSSELQQRLNYQLRQLDKIFGKNSNYLLVPYGTYPKSSDIVMYLLAKSPAYVKYRKKERIDITLDIQNYNFSKEVVLVFVDDFVGTGKSFSKWYKLRKIGNVCGSNFFIREEKAILAGVIMNDAMTFLRHTYPEVEVFAQTRDKLFKRNSSPFNLIGNLQSMRDLSLKYGSQIVTGFQLPNTPIYHPLGYGKSESLIAFDYGTPNNSLSIIWGDVKWHPIFPRASETRMKGASAIKQDAAFYLGLMNKLKIKFEQDVKETIRKKEIKLSARDDHSILVLLVLTEKKYSNLQICQVLGITLFEFDKIILKAHRKRLVSREGQLTRRGIEFLRLLKAKSNVFTFRENDTLDVKENNIFVPKSFGKRS